MQRTVVTGSVIAFAAAASAAAIFLSAALPASGGRPAAPKGDPAAFLIRIVGFVVADEYARAWPSLYPAHQEVAPRAEYVAYELQTPVGWKLRSAAVLRVAQRLRRIPGASERVPVTSVTLRLRIANPALETEGALTHTFNAVAVGSRWTWILTPSRYALYRADACNA